MDHIKLDTRSITERTTAVLRAQVDPAREVPSCDCRRVSCDADSLYSRGFWMLFGLRDCQTVKACRGTSHQLGADQFIVGLPLL